MTTCNRLLIYEPPQAEKVVFEMEDNMLQSQFGKGSTSGKDEVENGQLESVGYEPL